MTVDIAVPLSMDCTSRQFLQLLLNLKTTFNPRNKGFKYDIWFLLYIYVHVHIDTDCYGSRAKPTRYLFVGYCSILK